MNTDYSWSTGTTESAMRSLAVLALPESLTDELALVLLNDAEVDDPVGDLALVRGGNLTVVRDDEWRLDARVRTELLKYATETMGDRPRLHALLAAVAGGARTEVLADRLPTSYRDGSALAYHVAEVDASAGLHAYENSALDLRPGATWLSGMLAREQQERHILPDEAPELNFLFAITKYHDGKTAEAIQLLRPIAERRRVDRVTAFATHLVGQNDVLYGKGAAQGRGIRMLRRSLRIGEDLGDVTHISHASHTLALALLMRDRKQSGDEAEALLERAYELADHLGDDFGRAKILHTWGQSQMYSRDRAARRNAKAMLQQSLAIGQSLGIRRHQAAVLIHLAQLLQDEEPQLAREYREEAFSIDKRTAERTEGRTSKRSGRKR
jgi:hypothetical protein